MMTSTFLNFAENYIYFYLNWKIDFLRNQSFNLKSGQKYEYFVALKVLTRVVSLNSEFDIKNYMFL